MFKRHLAVLICALVIPAHFASAKVKKAHRARARVVSAASTCTHQGIFKLLFCSSPLMLQLDPKVAPAFTSAKGGANFDLLNQGSAQRVAWIAPESRASTLFLTLPDEQTGQITGIQQLFGDRTRGPDGRFAPNGYEALRKWDANADGWIDHRDPIFSRLRLWSDLDGDGVATEGELSPLVDFGVEAVSLDYQATTVQVDVFGNEVRLPSFVRMQDGSARPMYDVWLTGEKLERESGY